MASRQIVVLSGGNRGLGLAIVRHLLGQGHVVATFSRTTSEDIQRLRDDERYRESLRFQQVDATHTTDLIGFVKSIVGEFGRIDALVNNAAIAHDGLLAMMPAANIEQMLAVNLQSAMLLAKECSRAMLTQRGGNIVNVVSIVAERGFSGLSAYAATKAGMVGFTRCLARELGACNIRVNAVAPGFLDTDMSRNLDDRQRASIVRRTPLGRLGTVDDVMPVIEFLLSPSSGFITGQVITVDGGASA